MGGTLAHYAAHGDRVVLVCATGGETGLNRLDSEDIERLGDLRREELREACEILGIEPPIFLGYRDSGMEGAETNEHPDCLHQADLDQVARKVADVIDAERPDALITFEQNGWYGHPDHIKMYQAVRRAEDLLSEDAWPAIYCAAFAAEAGRYMIQVMEEAGEEIPEGYRNPLRLSYSLDVIPIVVDTSAYAEKKIAALNAHRTQMGPDGVEGRFLPEVLRVRTDREYFMPVEIHDAVPDVPPFERRGGLFGEPPPEPLVPFPILPPD